MTLLSENILADSIAAVGLLIALYYGLAGFACVRFYRRTLTTSVRHFVMRGLFPFLGGVMLLGAFATAPDRSNLPPGATTVRPQDPPEQ